MSSYFEQSPFDDEDLKECVVCGVPTEKTYCSRICFKLDLE